LLTPTLSVSFQRYPYPPSGFVTTLPTSYGALPLAADGPGRFVLPCPDGEAFWIGLIPEKAGGTEIVRVLASLASGDQLDVVTGAQVDPPPATDPTAELPHVTAPPAHGVAGIFRGEGTWWTFTRNAQPPSRACRGLDLTSPPRGSVHVRIVDPLHFEGLTGIAVSPLNPDGRYGGWRLP
jgi:hypothetical protein